MRIMLCQILTVRHLQLVSTHRFTNNLIDKGNGPLQYHQYLITSHSFNTLRQFEEAYRSLRNAHDYAMDLHNQRLSQLEKWSGKYPFSRLIKHPATSESAVKKNEGTVSSRSSSSSIQKSLKKSVQSKDSGCHAQSIVSRVTAADGGHAHLNAPLKIKDPELGSPSVASDEHKSDETNAIVYEPAQPLNLTNGSALQLGDGTEGKHMLQCL